MRKFTIFTTVAVMVLSGCTGRLPEVYSHVTENDYISEKYYLTEISPRNFGDTTPSNFGIFKKDGDGFELLMDIGEFTDIRNARAVTLVKDDTLYIVRECSILKYDLTFGTPAQSELRLDSFFPDTIEVLSINAIDKVYVYVYAITYEAPPAVFSPVCSSTDFSPYAAYFAFKLSGSGYFEITLDDVPIQKRY